MNDDDEVDGVDNETLSYPELYHHIQSLTLLSPVDGLDPFGLVPIYCITPGEMLNFR